MNRYESTFVLSCMIVYILWRYIVVTLASSNYLYICPTTILNKNNYALYFYK